MIHRPLLLAVPLLLSACTSFAPYTGPVWARVSLTFDK